MDARRFRVALSFSGDERQYVSDVAKHLADHFSSGQVFYDANYRAELARINMDVYLQSIYRDQSDIIVLFFSESYNEKIWCGLEWRAIRNLMVERSEDIIPVKMGMAQSPKGLFPLDGYLPGDTLAPAEVARDIIWRYDAGYGRIQATLAEAPFPGDDSKKAAVPDTKISLVSPLFRDSVISGEYILYVSRDRLAGLFEQVDIKTLALFADSKQEFPPYWPPGAKPEATGKRVVQQLAAVLHFLEETATIGDLNKIVSEKGSLSADWYQLEAIFTAEQWKEGMFTTKLKGKIGEYELILTCAVRNISGVIEENGQLFPTSMSAVLIIDDFPILLKGLVRLGAYERETKQLKGSALYLAVQPLRVQL
jgi:hypothetical protein